MKHLTLAMLACVGAVGCADEIDVFETPGEDVSPLVGSWEWQTEVSRLDVDEALHATQTSDFDNDGAEPSSYTMTPSSDDVLVLEGWLANAACDADVVCEGGRAYQRFHMSYHVDDQHFFPFAMVRKSGTPGVIGGAGVFEAFSVGETLLRGTGESFRLLESRWRLSLEADGRWASTTQTFAADQSEETAEGTWTLDDDGQLSLHDGATGETHRTLWKGDVVALDGLVFTRLSR